MKIFKRRKIVGLSILFISLIVYLLFTLSCHTLYMDISNSYFTGSNLCPACFESSLCSIYENKQLKLAGWTSVCFLSYYFNAKNVYFGEINKTKVVVKKLAHDWELLNGDKTICKLNDLPENCDVRRAMKTLCLEVLHLPVTLQYVMTVYNKVLEKIKGLTDITSCLSQRLIQHIHENVRETHSKITLHKDLQESEGEIIAAVVYSMIINPEPLILQAFPAKSGWPFPMYKGGCGRTVVEEFVGKTLAEYEDAPWPVRANLARQLIEMAQILTENSLNFALYLTDVNTHNFAVNEDQKVVLVDAENIIVVDRLQVRKEKPHGWSKPYTNDVIGCLDCLSFSPEDLCAHDLADHNYYAICAGILAPDAYYSSRNGFLHSIPPHIDLKTELSYLIKECAHPTSQFNRFLIVPKLVKALKFAEKEAL